MLNRKNKEMQIGENASIKLKSHIRANWIIIKLKKKNRREESIFIPSVIHACSSFGPPKSMETEDDIKIQIFPWTF